MPDYSIYVLDESDLTLSPGVQLDGVTQGDGSHLIGATITLNNDNFTEIMVSDDDTMFGDSDSSQTLNGPQEIDGTTYASGTGVEAEYSFVVTDGTNTWTIIGFNVSNSSPVYGTVEGIAVLGGPGGFPPVGVALTVLSNSESPNNEAADFATPICFTSGTLIQCENRVRKVEDLRLGDWVETMDSGLQQIRWISSDVFDAIGDAAPIEFAVGAIGNTEVLKVSPQHRLLHRSARAELSFGAPEVLVAAKHFLGCPGVTQAFGGTVNYIHFLFDRHEVVWANGIACESFHPGDASHGSLGKDAYDELMRLFPHIDTQTAYPTLRAHEAQVLLAA